MATHCLPYTEVSCTNTDVSYVMGFHGLICRFPAQTQICDGFPWSVRPWRPVFSSIPHRISSTNLTVINGLGQSLSYKDLFGAKLRPSSSLVIHHNPRR